MRVLARHIWGLLLLLPLTMAAQDPYYRRIDESDGLPSNSVYGIYQDQRGFIWIATDDGLCRYDGHSFRRFTSTTQTSRSGANIFEDRYHRIWYENFDGQLYYVSGDSLLALRQGEVPGFRRAHAMGDRLYVPSYRHLEVYDLRTLAFLEEGKLDGVTLGEVGFMGERYFWVNSGSAPVRIDTLGGFTAMPYRNAAGEELVGAMFDCGGGMFWLDYNDAGKGLWHVVGDHLEPFCKLLGQGMIQQHSQIDGRVWVAFGRGLQVIDARTGATLGDRLYFPDKSITAMLLDREGNHWLGTQDEGIMLVPDFSSRRIAAAGGTGLRRVVDSPLGLLVGTEDGAVLRLDERDGQFREIYRKGDRHAIDFLYADPDLLIVGAPKGDFLALPDLRHIEQFQAVIKDAVRIDHKYLAVNCPGASGFIQYAQGPALAPSIWDSLYRSAVNEANPRLCDLLPGRGRSVAFRPARQALYFGTSNGLMRVTPTGKSELRHQGGRLYISKMQVVGGAIFALSTLGRLYRVDAHDQVSEVRDLPIEGPYRLVKYLDGKLYVLSPGHLLQLRVQDGGLQFENAVSGLQAGAVSDIAWYHGRIALATRQGLILLDPGQATASLPPQFVITGLAIAGKQHAADSLVTVGHGENDVAIDYSILNFRTGGDFPLHYRINDGPWHKTDPESRQLLLAQLSPGDYAVAFCLGMPGSETVATVRLRIRNPFWLEPWFYLLWVVVLAGAGVGVIAMRSRAQARRHKLHLERLELENRLRHSTLVAIRSQMNPHFFFNALNTIQAYIFTDDKRNAAHYLGKFSKLARRVLEMSEKESVSLAEEIEAITLYLELEKSRFGEDFHFELEIGPGLVPQQVALPSMIIQPFVENAVKHGLLHKQGAKELRIHFSVQGDFLEIAVDDNGIGRKRSAELNRIRQDKHQSFSVQANQKRIDILNAGLDQIGVQYVDKQDPQGLASGTTVKITLPLKTYPPA